MPENSKFTSEQIEYLRVSPHVVSVTETTVNFTPEFRKLFYEQLHSGRKPEVIFALCGIDPEVLGPGRIRGFIQSVEAQAAEEKGFSDLGGKSDTERESTSSEHSTEADSMDLDALIKENNELKREIFFLKEQIKLILKTYADGLNM